MKPTLDFYKKYGAAIWPGARLVFHGIPDPTEEPVEFPADSTGLRNKDDIAGMIALARRLQPDARRILVVVGVSPLDLQVEWRTRQVLRGTAGTATVDFVSGATAQLDAATYTVFQPQLDNLPPLTRSLRLLFLLASSRIVDSRTMGSRPDHYPAHFILRRIARRVISTHEQIGRRPWQRRSK